MSARKVTGPQEEGYIGGDMSVTGKLSGEGHLAVEGRFDGEVDLVGTLTVLPGAQLTASVTAREADVAGTVHGNLNVTGLARVRSTGVVLGDMSAAALAIEPGAHVEGRFQTLAADVGGA